MMYMYSRVLNNSAGAVACTGGCKQPELVIEQHKINVEVTLSKLTIMQDLS